MTLVVSLVYLFCFACAGAYMLFGVLQMVAPARAIPVYRFFLGKKRFARHEGVFLAGTRRAWKLMGAGYIFFGLLVTYALMRSLHTL